MEYYFEIGRFGACGADPIIFRLDAFVRAGACGTAMIGRALFGCLRARICGAGGRFAGSGSGGRGGGVEFELYTGIGCLLKHDLRILMMSRLIGRRLL